MHMNVSKQNIQNACGVHCANGVDDDDAAMTSMKLACENVTVNKHMHWKRKKNVLILWAKKKKK